MDVADGAGGPISDGLTRGLRGMDLSVPLSIARQAAHVRFYAVVHAGLCGLVLALAALLGGLGVVVLVAVALRLALLPWEVRAGRTPASGRSAGVVRRVLQLAFIVAVLRGAPGALLEIATLLALVPMAAAGHSTPRRVRDVGATVLAGLTLSSVPCWFDDGAAGGSALAAAAILVVLATGHGMLIAHGRALVGDRAERADSARRRLLLDGLALHARERDAASAHVRGAALVHTRAARERVAGLRADLVGCRADAGAAVVALRDVVAELHPAARRSRELADRVRAVFEHRVEDRVPVRMTADDLAPPEQELVLAVARDVAEALRRAGVASGVAVSLQADAPGLALRVEAPVAPAALEAAWRAVGTTLRDMGGCWRVEAAHGGGSVATVRIPTAADGAGDHLADMAATPPRQLAVMLAGARLVFLACVWPYALVAGALDGTAILWTASAATAWQLGGLALALSRRWERYPLGWIGCMPDLLLLAVAIALTGGASSDLVPLLALLPLLYVWVFGLDALRRLDVAIVASLLAGTLAPWVLGRALHPAEEAGALLVVGWALALSLLIGLGRRHLHERVLALEHEARGLLAGALRAADGERRRLAFALHDGPLQTLLSLRQDLAEALVEPRADAGADARRSLFLAEREIEDALGDRRDDRPGRPLHDVLLDLLRRAAARDGVRTTLVADPARDADPRTDDLLAVFARELVTNVGRHARASRIDVRVERDPSGGVELVVADDGVGLADDRVVGALADGHVGLASCADRLRAPRGTITFEATPGGGTTARVRVPGGALPATARRDVDAVPVP